MSNKHYVEYFTNGERFMTMTYTSMSPVVPRVGERVAIRGYTLAVLSVKYILKYNTIEVNCKVER